MVIYAQFLDLNALKMMKVPEVYLQIISTSDHEYWKTTLMKQNMSTLHIAVGTLEMKDNEYVVKISDHKEMISFGFAKVKVKNSNKFLKNKIYVQVS